MSWEFMPIYDLAELRQRFDWVEALFHTPQDPVWHAEGDVGTHTQMVLDALQALPDFQALAPEAQEILRAAALLHDVEKPNTTREENGRIISPGHARRGEFTARTLLYQEFAAPPEIREAVAKLVRFHGLPLWAMEKPDHERAVLKASLEVNTEWLAILTEADIRGRICEDQEELLERIEFFREYCRELECFGKPKAFSSPLGKFRYFSGASDFADYEPFDDTKFEVTILSALPGTGKDTWIRRNISPETPVISLDELRRQNGWAPGDKSATGRLMQLAKEQARELMRGRQSFVWNATNINRQMRGQLIDLFVEYGAKVRIVALETDWRTLVKRNGNREHIVPGKVLGRMVSRWEPVQGWEAVEVEWVWV